MPSRSKQKGDRDERALVEAARAAGLQARRVPLSGAAEGFKGDVLITDASGKVWTAECKCRANSFKQIYGWMADHIDVLTLRADRKPRLVVMREDAFFDLISTTKGDTADGCE